MCLLPVSGFYLLGLHDLGSEEVGLPLELQGGLELGLSGLLGDSLGLGYLFCPLFGCELLSLGPGNLLTFGLGDFLAAAGIRCEGCYAGLVGLLFSYPSLRWRAR